MTLYGPLLLEDGTSILLEDGSELLAEGSSESTLSLPVASGSGSAYPLTAAAVLPVAPGTGHAYALFPAAVLPAASGTGAAHALFPAAVLAVASGAGAAFAPAAFLLLPGASGTGAAYAPLVPPLTGTAEGAGAAYVPLLPVPLPAAEGTGSAYLLAQVLPVAGGDGAAHPLLAAVLLPVAEGTGAAYLLAGEAQLPPPASGTGAAYALVPTVQLPAAAGRGRAGRLTPPAGSEFNPGYPDGTLDAKVELLLGGSWTDITDQALPDGQQSGSIKSGQPDGAQQPSPATMTATWDNPDYSLSPRNSSGPFFGDLKQNTPARISFASPYGTYLRLEADASDRAFVDDVPALHITGSLEIRVGVRLSDYRGGAVLAARIDNTQPSWVLQLARDGTLIWSWWDSGGTQRTVTSDAAAAVTWGAFRVTFDTATGTAAFYVSDGIDGAWTQLGDALSGTSGSATSVRAGNAPLVVGWSNSISGSQAFGQVSGFRLYSGIGGTVVADAAFSVQVPGVTSWTGLAGLTWKLAGGAELTSRDYRLHGELSSLAPTADVSGGMARVQAAVSGRLRRLQQGAAPTAESAIRRAILAQSGDLFPVSYWPMEDGAGSGFGVFSRTFGPAAGSQLVTAELGKVRPAADSSFEASAPLPTLNGDQLSVIMDAYTGGTAWAVRFLYKQGTQLPASGSTPLIEITTTGACTHVSVSVNTDGTLNFSGTLSSGSSAFNATELSYPQTAGPSWWSVECVTVSGGVQYALVAVAPGATSGNTQPETVTGHGSFGNVTGVTVNSGLLLDDTVFGHLSVQKAWASMFTLGAPLNAWRTELAADRFVRVCAENGIAARILGRPFVTQAMGPQPRGSVWTILKDCAQTEQGILFEPRDCFGLGFRTRESMSIQAAGLTMSFADANLRGDLQPVDDDSGLLNDVTGSTPGGTSWRVTLDDGSPRSVSEPPAGAGRYAGSVPFPLNVADDGELAAAVAFYLARVSVNEPRYRNVVGDLGIPGAPAADIARLRPGDLIQISDVPEIYQTADIRQLVMSATETFGPGWRIAWDCVPFSPYGGAPADSGTGAGAVLDTDGNGILDTDGNRILGTGA